VNIWLILACVAFGLAMVVFVAGINRPGGKSTAENDLSATMFVITMGALCLGVGGVLAIIGFAVKLF